MNTFDRNIINKINHQLNEGKTRVADWAVKELLDYIQYLEKRVILLSSLEIMETHKDLFKKLAELERTENEPR